MLNVRLFGNPRFSASSASITLTFAALMGIVFILTQHLQSVLAYDPLETGLRLVPTGIALIVCAALSAILDKRFGTKVVVTLGLALITVALGLLAQIEVGDGYGPVLASLLLIGAGMGLAMAPATDAVMGSVPVEQASVGSAMNDTSRMVGGALGVAVLGSVLSSGYGGGMDAATEALPAGSAEGASDSIGGALQIASALPAQAGDALRTSAEVSFVSGMSEAAVVAAGLTLARHADRAALPTCPRAGGSRFAA